jgi:Flp pilus assembly protein protease CpaA
MAPVLDAGPLGGSPRPWSWADRIAAGLLVLAGAGLAVWAVAGVGGWYRWALIAGCLLAQVAGWTDLRLQRVPNGLTVPGMILGLAVTGVRLAQGELGWGAVGMVALIWLGCLAVWGLRLFGGGDVKLMMALAAVAPDLDLVLAVAVALGVGLAVYLTLDARSGRWQRVAALIVTLGAGRALPSRAEVGESYRRRATPAAPWIACGMLLYGWFG